MPSPPPSTPSAATPPQSEMLNASLHFRAPAVIIPKLLESPEVTIEVVEAGDKKTFKAPRALICAKSEYFDAAFMNKMKETQTRVLELGEDADVTRVMMRLFVNWLHTGLVYVDEVADIPGITLREAAIPAPSLKRSATAPDNEPSAKRRNSGRTEYSEHTDDIGSTSQTKDGGREDLLAPAEPTAEPEDTEFRDHQDPLTWSYGSLFEVYVFADRYDTSALRNQIMQIIQYKKRDLQDLPGAGSIRFAVANLPPTSPLRRFLRAWFGTCLRIESFERCDLMNLLSRCPPEFLAECMITSIAYRDCKTHNQPRDCVF
ncbi:hypothetical protein CBER1_03142 [Cercospora berteroae]|uniref:BTB domain-containing protein n=1 Tax=Cercospora berteroae TaxID=357750 RepID=A0A2S6CK70_9PEZI|nr:hypothetical protein CBER1_03142 [Cercospora berteroae]